MLMRYLVAAGLVCVLGHQAASSEPIPAAAAFFAEKTSVLANAMSLNDATKSVSLYASLAAEAEQRFKDEPGTLADILMHLGQEEQSAGTSTAGTDEVAGQWLERAENLYRQTYGVKDDHYFAALNDLSPIGGSMIDVKIWNNAIRRWGPGLVKDDPKGHKILLLDNVGDALREHGHPVEAEAAYREGIALLKVRGEPPLGWAYGGLAYALEEQGRWAEATEVRRAMLDSLIVRARGAKTEDIIQWEQALAENLEKRGLMKGAQALRHDVAAHSDLLSKSGALGPVDLMAQDSLAQSLVQEGRYDEAITAYAELIASHKLEEGVDNGFQGKAETLVHAGQAALAADDLARAERWFNAAVRVSDSAAVGSDVASYAYAGLADIAYNRGDRDAQRAAAREGLHQLGQDIHSEVLRVHAAHLYRLAGQPDAAARLLTDRCSLNHIALRLDTSPFRPVQCSRELALASFELDGHDTYLDQAFAAAQLAIVSSAGDALTKAVAQAAAGLKGDAALADGYERALVRRNELTDKLAQSIAKQPNPAAADPLRSDLRATQAEVTRLAAGLRARQPRYWDYRAPEPVALAELMGGAGRAAALLHDDELLLLILVPSGGDYGLVFAVSRRGSAWAKLAMRGSDIAKSVTRLRLSIDGGAYGLPGAGATTVAFDRKEAFQLYQALFGDPVIAGLIDKAGTLLIVPSGPLLTLPPSLLVTSSPTGDDSDPAALRATPWLVRGKAIAILPTVASLRSLRTITVATSEPRVPLAGFADPDFTPATYASPAGLAGAPSRQKVTSAGSDSDMLLWAALPNLPALPGTRSEAEKLEREMGTPGVIRMGRDATETSLKSMNASGQLRRARVIEFATHGLVGGEFANVTEPALALARPQMPSLRDDGFLMASEASQLSLDADWVILSACNTASPEGHATEGLSGLARAFLYAGARSVLASHWRVSDIGTSLIVAALFDARSTGLTKAQRLRRAELSIIEDTGVSGGSDPMVWAPFVLIGDPD